MCFVISQGAPICFEMHIFNRDTFNIVCFLRYEKHNIHTGAPSSRGVELVEVPTDSIRKDMYKICKTFRSFSLYVGLYSFFF